VSRWASEDGAVAGAEALVFGVLIFVMGTLIVVNAWGVVDAKLAASAAAREAARLVVEAAEGDGDPTAAARRAAGATLAGHGRDPGRLARFEIRQADPSDGTLTRCERVVVDVGLEVSTVRIPWVGAFGGTVAVNGTHSEVVDPLRSGVAGEVDCDV
jgi:hypothetical protein